MTKLMTNQYGLFVRSLVGIAWLFAIGNAESNDLRVATWNIEWLGDQINDRQHRDNQDYARLERYADSLNADVVAFQEVENQEAAKKVFPKDKWQLFISNRNNKQRTGFAVKKRVKVNRHHDDVKLLDRRFLRHGVDIGITHDDHEVRLLSVHLKSGCFSNKHDKNKNRKTKKACDKLTGQIPDLEKWMEKRYNDRVPFVVAGDWNRRLNITNDRIWNDLNDNEPEGLHLLRAGEGRQAKCWGARYPDFIDHIVLGSTQKLQWKVTDDSFTEIVYKEGKEMEEKLSDHCPIVVSARLH